MAHAFLPARGRLRSVVFVHLMEERGAAIVAADVVFEIRDGVRLLNGGHRATLLWVRRRGPVIAAGAAGTTEHATRGEQRGGLPPRPRRRTLPVARHGRPPCRGARGTGMGDHDAARSPGSPAACTG